MKTIMSSGPGFFTARSRKVDPEIPAGALRIYVARIEIYEIPPGNEMDDISFELLVAKAQDNPTMAKALIELGKAISANKVMLEKEANK